MPNRDGRHFSSCCLCSIYSWYTVCLVTGPTSPDVKHSLYPLEDVIHQFLFQHCLVVLTACLLRETYIYFWFACMGSLGSINPCSAVHSCFHDSQQLTAPLVALIMAQCMTQIADHDYAHQLKQSIWKSNMTTRHYLLIHCTVNLPS